MRRTRRLAPVAAIVAAASLLAPSAAMAAAPSNDRYLDSVHLAQVPALEAARTGGATLDQYEHRPCGYIGKTVWYSFYSAADQILTVNTFGSNFDTVLAVYAEDAGTGAGSDTPPGASYLRGCNDDAAGSQQSKVTIRVATHEQVYIQVGGYRGASGRLALNINTKPANDRLDQASPLFQLWWEGDYAESHRELYTKKATLAAGEPQPCAPIGRSVWWSADMSSFAWAPLGDEERTVYVDTAGSDFDTVLAVYRLPKGLPPTFGNLVLVGCDDDSGPGATSSFAVPFNLDDHLYFQVAGYGSAFGQLRFNVEVRPWIN